MPFQITHLIERVYRCIDCGEGYMCNSGHTKRCPECRIPANKEREKRRQQRVAAQQRAEREAAKVKK